MQGVIDQRFTGLGAAAQRIGCDVLDEVAPDRALLDREGRGSLLLQFEPVQPVT